MAKDPIYAKKIRDDWAKRKRRSRQAVPRTPNSKPTPHEYSKEEQLYWAIDEFSKLSKTHGNRKYGLEVFERLMEMDSETGSLGTNLISNLLLHQLRYIF